MQLDLLKTFHVVARNKSFSKAAQELFLTQPTVSTQIQKLEHSLKTILFDRNKKQIVLTPKGEILYHYTLQLFELFSDIENAFQEYNQIQSGRIEIAASTVVATYFLPEIISEFRSYYPNIDLRVRIGNSESVARDVLNRDVDFGLCARILSQPEFIQYQLLSERYIVVASPRSKWARYNRKLCVPEFVQASIVTREKGARSQTKIEEWIKQQGLYSFNSHCVVNSMEMAKQLAISGVGIVTLPSITVKNEIQQGLLVELNVENFNLSTGYYLNYLRSSNVSPACLKFIMLLKERRRDFLAIL